MLFFACPFERSEDMTAFAMVQPRWVTPVPSNDDVIAPL
jgi:hypothetical protein